MNKKALAAVYAGVGKPFELREYPICEPGRGMARMSLVASGVCGTDLHIHSGRLAIQPEKIIGHEFIGRIDALGEGVNGLKVGDSVISDIACPCGKCLLCRDGDDANCVNMGVTNGGNPEQEPHFWGGYAQMSFSPAENLIKIPDGIDPLVVAVYACAGPTCLHSFRLGHEAGFDVKKVDIAVVQGAGPVGTFAVMYLKAMGVKNILAVSARSNGKKEELLRSLGATEVFNLETHGEEKISEEIARLSGGIGADLVFEASGGAQAIPVGMRLLRNRGFYLVPGQYSNRGEIPIQPNLITFKALRIIGSSQYSVSDVSAYLEFLGSNTHLHQSIRSLATLYKVEQINEAFEDIKSGKTVKALLTL